MASALLHTSFLPTSASSRKHVLPTRTSCAQRIVALTTREDAGAQRTPSPSLDRRELLAGGLAGTLAAVDRANASPAGDPDLKTCGPADVNGTFIACCPPKPKRATIDFKPDTGPMRVRPIAHQANEDYIAKYNEAYKRMKALPSDDPRSFMQQANIHCAYCNYGYRQEQDFTKKLQIHFSWLFLPWHRWYLYFHEKILGDLIGDPTFALPYWNWDNQSGGNIIPEFFIREATPAFDVNRNPKFSNGSGVLPMVDLSGANQNQRPQEEIPDNNINVMSQTVAKVVDPYTFFGSPYRMGDSVPSNSGQGQLEAAPHTALHVFTSRGNTSETPNGEDMGNFYSAGRDPAFYCHHCNVDRMWNVWRTIPGHEDITEPDFLNTEFLFFDQNQDLVRCKVKECIDAEKNLKSKYQDNPADQKWITYNPPSAKANRTASLVPDVGKAIAAANYRELGPSSSASQDISVTTSPLTVSVKQPKKAGNSKDEILIIEGVRLNMAKNTSFTVYIDYPEANISTTSNCIEYVGSFNNIPHFMTGETGEMFFDTNARFSIKKNVEALKLTNSDKITVTIVPKGADAFTVKGATISYV